MYHENLFNGSAPVLSAGETELREFLATNAGALRHAAALLAGRRGARIVSAIRDGLGQPGRLTRRMRRLLLELRDMLFLEHAHDEFWEDAGCFALLEPDDPAVSAAKTAGYLDIALDCASDPEAAPATLIRAARDFADRDPAFAAPTVLYSIAHLLAGRGFDASPPDMDDAVDHLMTASRQLDRMASSMAELRQMADRHAGNDLMVRSLRSKISELEMNARNYGA